MVLGVEVVLRVVCELLNSAELVGGCCDDNLSAAGVDLSGGGASVDMVGGSPEALSVVAWPGVTVAPAVGFTVTADTSAAPYDVSFVEVCPCVRVTDSLETGGKVKECHYLFKVFTVSFQFTAGKLAFGTVCLKDFVGAHQRQK